MKDGHMSADDLQLIKLQYRKLLDYYLKFRGLLMDLEGLLLTVVIITSTLPPPPPAKNNNNKKTHKKQQQNPAQECKKGKRKKIFV